MLERLLYERQEMPIAEAEVMAAVAAQNGGQRNSLIVKFYLDAVLDERASDGWTEHKFDAVSGEPRVIKHPGAGRPIYRDEEHIEVRAPGDKDEIRRRQIREFDKQRFPTEYAAFQKGLEAPETGTPLDKLPFVTKSQALEFQAVGIRTAENLRDCSDANGQKFMDFQRLKRRVVDFLAVAEGNAPHERLRVELDQRDVQIALQQEQIKQLAEKFESLSKGQNQSQKK